MPEPASAAVGRDFSERLWPSPWVFLATALVVPASLLVFLPISPVAGVVTAIVLYGGCVGLLVAGTPTVTVGAGVLRAGRARIPLEHVGAAHAFSDAEATRERGPDLDARAFLVIRGWVDPVVRIEVRDPDDPVPYWLVSTRRPDDLVAALTPRT